MADRKILVVDDEIHIVQVIAIKLRNNGFEVLTAENGAQALDIAKKHKPDLVITDYQMPVMTGIEFIENLRQIADTAETPVIMLTARGFAIDQERKNELDIATFLSKPFSPREVLQCVEDVLQQVSA
ncbi:MAG: two-component system response regulator [Planctomycetota bacterium]|mgnify:CR=1 FL=1|nr:MAG: two-component system response regulator [Planctomycetota bacterium]